MFDGVWVENTCLMQLLNVDQHFFLGQCSFGHFKSVPALHWPHIMLSMMSVPALFVMSAIVTTLIHNLTTFTCLSSSLVIPFNLTILSIIDLSFSRCNFGARAPSIHKLRFSNLFHSFLQVHHITPFDVWYWSSSVIQDGCYEPTPELHSCKRHFEIFAHHFVPSQLL